MVRKLKPMISGVAGEFYAAAELSRRGYIATLTMKNTQGIDILAASQDGKKSVTIQVKTQQGGRKGWMLNKKSETFHANNHYYVFVYFPNTTDAPEYHIVPSKIVAEYVKTSHADWLKGKKRDGTKRKDTTIRKYFDIGNKYENNWAVLGL